MKTNANIIVRIAPSIAPFLLPAIKAWCPYVTKAPLLNNKIVFNKGIANGSKGVIPNGGQVPPISTAGAKLEWKKAQNTDKKANISLIINNTILALKPFLTSFVWCPKYVPFYYNISKP